MSSRRREQILENCRWLFDQEVQITTFVVRRYLKGIPNLDNSVSRGPSELRYYAIVLPKECSLKSLTETDIEKKILFKESHLLSSDGAITALLGAVEKKIGTVLEEDPGNDGRIRINPLELPIKSGEKQGKNPPAKHTTGKPPSLPLPVGGETPPGITVSSSRTELLPPAELVAPEEALQRFFKNLLNKNKEKRAQAAGQETTEKASGRDLKNDVDTKTRDDISDGPSQLTERNLSLLEKETKRTKVAKSEVTRLTSENLSLLEKETKRTKVAKSEVTRLTSENLSLLGKETKRTKAAMPKATRPTLPEKPSLKKKKPTPGPKPKKFLRGRPVVSSKDYAKSHPKPECISTPLESDPINSTDPLPKLPPGGFELEHRIVKLEEKVHTLDAFVKTMQPRPYQLGEPSTPDDTGFHYMSNPIMTPTTSVASDTTFPLQRISM